MERFFLFHPRISWQKETYTFPILLFLQFSYLHKQMANFEFITDHLEHFLPNLILKRSQSYL